MPKKETVGTGITKHTRTMYDVTGETPRDTKAAQVAFRRATRAIGEKGLWGASTEDMRQACDVILEGKDTNRDFEADSQECFACRIRQYIEMVDSALREGAAEVAASTALQAGALWATAAMKWNWETEALYGQAGLKRLEGARETAIAAKKEGASRRRWLIGKMLPDTKLAGGALDSHLIKRLRDEHGIDVSARTIRRDLEKIRSV